VATDLGYARLEIGWESTGMLWIPFHRSYNKICQSAVFQG